MAFDLLAEGLGFGAVLAVPCALLALRRWRRGGRGAGRAQAALGCVGRLTELLGQIQQHRGMSAALLSGDAAFAARLPARQTAIEELFSALLRDAAREDGERLPCFTTQDLQALRFRWRELVERLRRLTPEESFQQHCRLLATVLGWLAALGEARIVPALPAAGAAAVRKLVADLPALAECLGQARALGSAVAARGRCSPVSRVRLHFLVARATELLTRAAGGGAGGQAHAPAAHFLQTLRERVLHSAETGIDAATCFRLGTEAVDAVFAWLAAEQAALGRALDAAPVSAAADAWATARPVRCRG